LRALWLRGWRVGAWPTRHRVPQCAMLVLPSTHLPLQAGMLLLPFDMIFLKMGHCDGSILYFLVDYFNGFHCCYSERRHGHGVNALPCHALGSMQPTS